MQVYTDSAVSTVAIFSEIGIHDLTRVIRTTISWLDSASGGYRGMFFCSQGRYVLRTLHWARRTEREENRIGLREARHFINECRREGLCSVSHALSR